MTGQALAGLQVVELGGEVSAPYLGKLFADFGADVVKVEPPEGDPSRRMGPFPGDIPHPEKSGMFMYLNTNKLGITLNLRTQAARSVLRGLLERADVFVENNAPSYMEELGLTYASLQQLNPRLVMASLTPFGQSGPYRDYKGSPLVTFALSGMCYETPSGGVGEEWLQTRPPLTGWGWQLAFISAGNAAWATLAALLSRTASGRGQHVDASEVESGAANLRTNVPETSYTPLPPGWSKFKRSVRGGGQLYPAKDGWVAIGANDEHQWRRWKEVMGNPEWAEAEVFATMADRRNNADAVRALASEWTLQHTRAEIYNRVQDALTIAFPVYNPQEVVEDEQNQAREIFVEQEHPVAGRVRFPGAPFKMSATPWQLRRPAPQLGEHNHEVLCGRLGYSTQELLELRHTGAI